MRPLLIEANRFKRGCPDSGSVSDRKGSQTTFVLRRSHYNTLLRGIFFLARSENYSEISCTNKCRKIKVRTFKGQYAIYAYNLFGGNVFLTNGIWKPGIQKVTNEKGGKFGQQGRSERSWV